MLLVSSLWGEPTGLSLLSVSLGRATLRLTRMNAFLPLQTTSSYISFKA